MPAHDKCPNCSGLELVGGVVKVGWRVHHRNPEDRGLQWPYISPHFPLPTDLFFKDIEIRHPAWDFKQKSRDHFYHGGYQVFRLPKLR